MEVQADVFVSSVATDDWEDDPEVGGEMHLLCEGVGVEAGLSRFEESTAPIEWVIPGREVLIVLEAEARIEIAGGATLELKPGDIASLPAGALTTWHLTTPFKEFWTIDR